VFTAPGPTQLTRVRALDVHRVVEIERLARECVSSGDEAARASFVAASTPISTAYMTAALMNAGMS
jgi:hypothetical protein